MMKGTRMLVVDDDPGILEVLGMRLEAMGFDVTLCSTPADAERALHAGAFDVALFDLRMEPVDGIALMQAAHQIQARLPVLIMTAHGTVDSAVEAIKEGAFDFLTKPFVAEELRGKIGRALAERRWARDRTLLRRVGETLASSGRMDHILDLVARATLEATETERTVVFLREKGILDARASAGQSATPLTDLQGAAEAAMKSCARQQVSQPEDRMLLAAPLLVDGAPEGALVVEHPSYVQPTDDDLELLGLFAGQAAVAVKNTRELSRLRSGALAALGRVATQVAHDLNNPLGGLKLYGRLLEQRLAKAGDSHGEALAQKMGRAVDRLSELVADITAYGRPAELRRERTGVNGLLEECLALVQDRVAERSIRVIADLGDAVGALALDARELHKAFLNLVVNAIDAMEPGGTLTVRSRRGEDGKVEILVEDTGCGMDEETRAHIFELFFTTKPSGTGLGMSIVRSAMERHGGQVEVDSAPGRGTRVRVVLPPDERRRRTLSSFE